MTVIRPSIKDVLCLEKIPIVLEESYETRLLPWVITCIRKRGRLLLGKNWTQRCNRKMVRTNILLKKKKAVGHHPLGKPGKFANNIFSFLNAAKENRC